ncbi:MAG: o-succinylbenzoate--CoA ligase [Polyangiaceae bacterium]|nr:o-succinylbenzoate--CoA ligase [Polyangiaceae bacterium]
MSHSLSLLDAAREVPQRPALFAQGAPRSFADLALRTAALAAHLRASGIGPGSRVALIAQNRVETVLTVYALLEIGAAIVPVHPRLTPPEVTALLADGSSDLLLRDTDLDVLLDASGPSPSAALQPPKSRPDPSSLFAVVHTSGTTGRPKGAMLTRGNLLASAAASAQNLGFCDTDRWLACMPLCHIGGLSIVTRCLLARVPFILEPRFDAPAILEALRRDRATLLSVVPTMLQALLEADHQNLLARLRAVLVGGAATPPALLDECARRRVPALTTYGLTEGCSQITSQRPRDPATREPGSGKPLAGVEIRIERDPSSPSSEIGRIHFRGPMRMRGYWPSDGLSPGAPLPSLDPAAWFDTGDLGAFDEQGRLHVFARRTDLIVTGGENVYPAEVERVIEAVPGVARAMVFGVPDPRWGQIVAAALVLDPARPASLDRVAAELSCRLAAHKRPRRLCAASALPITPSGKLDRASASEHFAPLLSPFPPPARP